MHDLATAQLTEKIKLAPTVAPAAELCIVVPTFNERDNVEPLLDRLDKVLAGIDWEVIFVDDNSPDKTSETIRRRGQLDPRVRCIRRIARRGLSSAVIEGLLATSALFVAVMDGDLQHDEAVLTRMLDLLRQERADLVIATRYSGVGTATGLSSDRRKFLSRVGVRLARMLIRANITDPVSGFFMLRRDVIDRVAMQLSGVGTKILIDILASASPPLSVAEVPYRFRCRNTGVSKFDAATAVEYVALLAHKLAGHVVPPRMLLFGMVGASGVVVNLVILGVLLRREISPTTAAIIATLIAMISNFFLNNLVTYRDRRLVGWRAFLGLLSFIAICALGAAVNVAIFKELYAATQMWLLAGIIGALVGALLNYSVSSMFTWSNRM